MSSLITVPSPTPWRRVIVVGIGLAAVVAIVMLAFSWPSVTAKPHGIPVSVTGPAAQVVPLEKGLAAAAPGVFSFVPANNRNRAVSQVKDRTSYGALVLGGRPEILTSSAASTATSQLLIGLAPVLQAQLTVAAHAAGAPSTETVTVTVSDVVPLSPDDPRGSGLTAAAFPLTLGGMLGGLAAALLIVGALRRVIAVAAYVIVAGFGLAAILQAWFGVLQGNYIVNAGAIALTLLAISATVVGFASLIGRIGTAVGPIVFLLIANPISSATQPLQFLPAPWGQIGQWFPPGAGATLLRDLSYFPEAAALFPWLVLSVWSALGIALALIGHFREGIRVRLEQDTLPSRAHDAGTTNVTTQPAAAAA